MPRGICTIIAACPGEHGPIDGPNINLKDQMADAAPAALAICQILAFNSVKHKRTCETNRPSVTVRNSVTHETSVPSYMGMMLHAHTRKRELVDRLSHLGMNISYDRVLTWV